MCIENYIYTDDTNECIECDFIADFYLKHKGDCVCPRCKSKDYYIVVKTLNNMGENK